MKKKKKAQVMWKCKKILLLSFAILIVLFFIISLGKYMKKKKIANKYSQKEISVDTTELLDLVGLMDSYGVPYDKSVDASFFDKLAKDLDNKGKLGSSLDLFNLYANKTWQVDGIFDNRVTIGEFNSIQNFSLDFTRHKYPEQIKEGLTYPLDDAIKNVTIYDYLKDLQNPIVIYSCTGNDLFYYFGASPESLTPQKCWDIATHFKTEARTLGNHVKGNLDTILSCNPESEVYVLGLYLPSDNLFLNAVADGVIKKINKEIRKACENYPNAHYVDVSCLSFCVLDGDFHPNATGQHVIAAILAEQISQTNKIQAANTISKTTKAIKNTDPENTFDAKAIALQLHESIEKSNLPLSDYVEYAVAFENALYDCNLEEINYMQIETIKAYMLQFATKEEVPIIDKALDIQIAEKKMLFNVNEKENALNSSTVKNDKMSLIPYLQPK